MQTLSSFYWPRQKKNSQKKKQTCGFRTVLRLRKSSSFWCPCRRKLTVQEQQYFDNSSTYQPVVCSSSFPFTFTVTIQSLETFAMTAYGRLLWCYSFIKSLLTTVTCNLCTWLFLARVYMNIKIAIGEKYILCNSEILFLINSLYSDEVIIIIIISVMQLGHLLTRSGLTYPEVSSKAYHDSFCQLGSSIPLPWVIYFEAFYLHVFTYICCILMGCGKT